MTVLDIARRRLSSQRISLAKPDQPDKVLTWLGAIQAQDYANAKWAVGLRCSDATDSSIEQAIIDRSLIRTWLLRGTLHFVAAEDVRWVLALVAPRLIAQAARRNRELKLDEATFSRGLKIINQTLKGGEQVARPDILRAFERGGISPDGQRGYHLLQRAALEGLICFGPMQGNQPTFVLLDEWAPLSRRLEGELALSELARRYFSSHGPATEQDFIWWSGLAASQARAGLEILKPELQQERVGDQTFWLRQNGAIVEDRPPGAYLLPGYDEYYLGYTDRSAILDARHEKRAVSSNGVFRPMLVVDGQVVGVWQREVKKDTVVIRLEPFEDLSRTVAQMLPAAAIPYGAFLERKVVFA
jgi:hypothetical protein